MKKRYLSLVVLVLISMSGCVQVDDTSIPKLQQTIIFENFQNITTGTGSNEPAVTIPSWINYNRLGSRKWFGRSSTINGNSVRYAEFNSFFSVAAVDPFDEVWMITPVMDFSNTKNETLRFKTRTRFWAGECLKVLISEDFDGTQEGITLATWTELEVSLPTTSMDLGSPFVENSVDISSDSNRVYVAFKYEGSKQTGLTTTYHINDVIIFENN
jgi:hypothetical protein